MELTKSDDWIIKQLLTIGSTAAGIVAGESPYTSPAQLYDTMVYAADGIITSKELNDDMRRGLLTEPLHRQLLENELGIRVHDHDQDVFIENDEYPWAHALPDGWIVVNDLQIPVQLKCPRVRSWHEIKLKGLHGYWLLGSQHCIAVCGVPYEHFSVLNPETMRLLQFPVYRDDELIASLMEIEKTFYANFMERNRPPEHIEKKIEMPSTVGGELITIDTPDAIDTARTYLDALGLYNDAKALREQAEAKVKELVGDMEVVELPGLRVYNRTQAGRKTLDTKALKKDGIDLEKYQKVGEPFRTFRAYPLGK